MSNPNLDVLERIDERRHAAEKRLQKRIEHLLAGLSPKVRM